MRIRGTGKYNAAYSFVLLGNRLLLNATNSIGLNIVVLNRTTLSVVANKSFDTYNISSQSSIREILYNLYTYSNNSMTNNTATKNITITDKYSKSHDMAKLLMGLDEHYIVAIVSYYGWERMLTDDLCNLMREAGSYAF